MTVGRPEAFWLLALLPPIVMLQVRRYLTGRRDLHALIGARRDDVQGIYLIKWLFGSLSFLVVLICAIVALADLSWGRRPVREDRQGIDVVAVVDVSRSMLAGDIAPSRLERARDLLRGLVQQLSDNRFALVIFKGAALSAIPLTEDTIVIDSFLAALDTEILTTPGTDIEAGLNAALDLLRSDRHRNRAIVLFSDGEFLRGSPVEAALVAAGQGIPIYVVATATAQGAPIPLADGTMVVDRRGQPVISRPNLETLHEIGEISGGTLIDIAQPNAFRLLVRTIQGQQRTQGQRGFRLVDVRRYRLFLSAALFFLALHIAIWAIRWRGVL